MESSGHLQLSAWVNVQNTNKGKIPDANFLNIIPTVKYMSADLFLLMSSDNLSTLDATLPSPVHLGSHDKVV